MDLLQASKMKTLILDIDYTLNTDNPADTLAVAREREYGEYSQQTWDLFAKQAAKMNIKPHPIPKEHYKEFTKHYDQVIIITGRPEKFRKWSEKWLNKNGFEYDELIHRPDAEIRMTSKEVKQHMAARYGLFENPSDFVAIDDDKDVVAYYRSLGIKTFQAPFEWPDALEYHKKLGENKMPVKSKRLTESQKDRIVKLRKQGKSHREIADKIGCAKSTVGRILQETQSKVRKLKRKPRAAKKRTTTRTARTSKAAAAKKKAKVISFPETKVEEEQQIDVFKNFALTLAVAFTVGASIYILNLLYG